jgi:hypothetical protein
MRCALHVARVRGKKYIQSGNLCARVHMGDLEVDGRIIIRHLNVRVWTGF